MSQEKDPKIFSKAEQKKQTTAAWNKRAREGWREGVGPHTFFTDFCAEHREKLGTEALDIGCGNGRYLVPLAQAGFNVVGVDLSEEMLKGAVNALAKSGLKDKARLVIGESTALQFPDNSFDFVISIGVMHHGDWGDAQKSFSEVARVLKPGKFFLLQVRSDKDTARQRERVADYGLTAADIEGSMQGVARHHFSKDELLLLAAENGFDIAIAPTESSAVEAKNTRKGEVRWWMVLRKK